MSKDLIERIGKEKIIQEMNKANSFNELCNSLNAGYRYIVLALSKLNLLEYFKQKIYNYKKQHSQLKFYSALSYMYYDSIQHHYKIDCHKWCQLFINNKIKTNNFSKAKNILIKAEYKENKCECCGISNWNGKPITLQLHHVDGNRNNNNLSNLQLLCPNCHSQTDNYGSKNAAKKEKNKKKKIKIKQTKIKKSNYVNCPQCGKSMRKTSKLCSDCSRHSSRIQKRKVQRPSKEQLENMLKSTLNICAISRIFNVSDNAIRKWCKCYEIDYKQYKKQKKVQNNKPKKEIKTLTFNGKTLSISQWSIELNIPINTIYHRLNKKKSIKQILKQK